jgi:acetoacetyl-CoA synthetase
MATVTEGTLLGEPSAAASEGSRLAAYMRWLAAARGRRFRDYDELWRWSTEDLDGFWGSLWEHFEIRADGAPRAVLGRREMPGAQWFPGTRLNFAEHVFRRARLEATAIVHSSETRPLAELSWSELRRQTAAIAAGLRRLGVERG